MPRPLKCRRVAFLPEATYFKPAGVPLRLLDEVLLSVEEAEAIRLKDLEGLAQTPGAEKMLPAPLVLASSVGLGAVLLAAAAAKIRSALQRAPEACCHAEG